MENCFMTRRRNSGGIAEPATMPNLDRTSVNQLKDGTMGSETVEVEDVLER